MEENLKLKARQHSLKDLYLSSLILSLLGRDIVSMVEMGAIKPIDIFRRVFLVPSIFKFTVKKFEKEAI